MPESRYHNERGIIGWMASNPIAANLLLVIVLLALGIYTVTMAASLDQWLVDSDARVRLEARFTELHQSLRQNTAEKAAAAILPYLDGNAEWKPSGQAA